MSLVLPLLLRECKATTTPKVRNESYLPLSMDLINVHSFANKYSAVALVSGPTKVSITCSLFVHRESLASSTHCA